MRSISSKFLKANKGDLFYESPTRNAAPRLLEFRRIFYDNTSEHVEFIDLSNSTKEKKFSFLVDADDRYGHFPPLTSTNLRKIQARYDNLAQELSVYSHLLRQIQKHNK